jgi:hypothetical protein
MAEREESFFSSGPTRSSLSFRRFLRVPGSPSSVDSVENCAPGWRSFDKKLARVRLPLL